MLKIFKKKLSDACKATARLRCKSSKNLATFGIVRQTISMVRSYAVFEIFFSLGEKHGVTVAVFAAWHTIHDQSDSTSIRRYNSFATPTSQSPESSPFRT